MGGGEGVTYYTVYNEKYLTAMNIINSIPRRAPKCISTTERAMELELKPKCGS